MKCPICEKELCWENDFSCEDVNLFGDGCEEGIIGCYHCPNCDADIEIRTGCTCDK